MSEIAERVSERVWSFTLRVRTDVTQERVWEAWREVSQWKEWSPGVAEASVDMFEVGGEISMVTREGEVVSLIEEMVEGVEFVALAERDGISVRTLHLYDAETSEVVYSTVVSGDVAEEELSEIGERVTAGTFAEIRGLLAWAK